MPNDTRDTNSDDHSDTRSDDQPETFGIHHVTNICTDMDATRTFYGDVLGLHTVKRTENYGDPGTLHYYFSPTPEGEPRTVISYFEYQGSHGTPDGGASHHFALGVEDEDALREWQSHIREHGVRVSPVMDRPYFKSIYTSDHDGLTIEFATAGPGFGVDEEEPGSTHVDPPTGGK